MSNLLGDAERDDQQVHSGSISKEADAALADIKRVIERRYRKLLGGRPWVFNALLGGRLRTLSKELLERSDIVERGEGENDEATNKSETGA